jgi:hypothetical protein
MTFARDVDLPQVIAAMRNGALLHEFNPDADSIRELPLRDGSYGALMTWKAFGLRTGQLSRCVESAAGEMVWERRCEVLPDALGAGRYTAFKWDEARCTEAEGVGTECDLEIQGRIRDFLFMKSPVLTVRAKRQALINWGRFWYLLENGATSTRFSNPIFDRSNLKADIEAWSKDGLARAKAEGPAFALTRRASFSEEEARSGSKDRR